MSARAGGLPLTLLLVVWPALVFAQGRLPEPGAAVDALPGDAWTQSSPHFELGYERPWPLAALDRASARGRLTLHRALAARGEFSWLQAGPVRTGRWGAHLRWHDSTGFVQAGVLQEEVSVRNAGRESQSRWQLGVGCAVGALLLAARQERGTGQDARHPLVRSEVVVRLQGETWGLAARRVSSPWGEAARWEFGVSFGATEDSGLALRGGETGERVCLRWARGARLHSASVVLDGPRAGAFALAVGWR